MKKEGKGILQKIFTGLLTLAMVVTMLNLPIFAQTVKAEEQVKIEITYLYVNTAGENSLYVDTQYIPAGTTWENFFENYQKCYSNGTITDADANNVWEMSVQNTMCDEEDSYSYYNMVTKFDVVTNFNQYSDCAYVTFYGYPSTYKYAYFSFEYYENEECVNGGTGWEILIPANYSFASDEAIAFVGRNKEIYSYVAELCNTPGASVVVEGAYDASGDEMRCDGYNVKITISTSSNESDTVDSTGSAGSTAGSDSADSASVSAESTYLSDSGVEMRRIAAQGNGATAIDGAAEYIPTGTKFTCVELTSGEVYDLAAEIVSTNISKADGFWVFNMNLTDVSNAAIHQLNGFINVMLPIPEGLNIADGKKLVVYRIEDDGTLTKCDTVTDNGYILFATDHFSTYVVVEETAVTSPKTGDDNVIFVWIAIALAAGIGSIFFWKKFRLQNRMV